MFYRGFIALQYLTCFAGVVVSCVFLFLSRTCHHTCNGRSYFSTRPDHDRTRPERNPTRERAGPIATRQDPTSRPTGQVCFGCRGFCCGVFGMCLWLDWGVVGTRARGEGSLPPHKTSCGQYDICIGRATRQNSLSDRSTNRCLTPHYHRHHHRVDFLVLATMVDDLTADGYVGADVVANGLMF